MKTRSTDSAAT